MRFGDDWCGVFIRGDNAFAFAASVRDVLRGVALGEKPPFWSVRAVEGLAELLEQANEHRPDFPAAAVQFAALVPPPTPSESPTRSAGSQE